MSHYDYTELLKKSRIRRGECVECGASEANGPCACSSKQAAVSPNIRVTGAESAANGNDVQTKLLRNPFEGTPQATDFENGYQAAQGLGHLEINKAVPDQIESLARQDPAWRSGFAQAALSMGCGIIARQIDPNAKVATMLLSLPFDMNVKIASALGTIAGTLAGAGLGSGIGYAAGEMMPSGVTHQTPVPTDGAILSHLPELTSPGDTFHEHSQAAVADVNKWIDRSNDWTTHGVHQMNENLAQMDRDADRNAQSQHAHIGAGVGAAGGAAIGHAMTRKHAALEYFKVAGPIWNRAGMFLSGGIAPAVTYQNAMNKELDKYPELTPGEREGAEGGFFHPLASGIPAGLAGLGGGLGGAALGALVGDTVDVSNGDEIGAAIGGASGVLAASGFAGNAMGHRNGRAFAEEQLGKRFRPGYAGSLPKMASAYFEMIGA